MFAPVQLATEEGGEPSRELEAAPLCADGLPPPALDVIDFELLSWVGKKSWKDLAAAVGLSTLAVRQRVQRPAFQGAMARLQRAWFDQLARGEFGGLALAKANGVSAIKTALLLMRGSTRDNVRLDAAKWIAQLGGIQAPAPSVIERPETLVDEMTQEELDHFALTNEFPRRLADRLARVAATVLQRRAEITVDADANPAEWEATNLDPMTAKAHAEAAMPLEAPEDDEGPAWASLPDETTMEKEVE